MPDRGRLGPHRVGDRVGDGADPIDLLVEEHLPLRNRCRWRSMTQKRDFRFFSSTGIQKALHTVTSEGEAACASHANTGSPGPARQVEPTRLKPELLM